MSRSGHIAIVGVACKYPDADTPEQLWENILSQRRAFRNMPANRLSPDYFSQDKKLIDLIYSKKVAVLKNYLFDRTQFKISSGNFNTADLTHWLALEVASDALGNAGLDNLDDVVRAKTGVIIGNTLTGEFSRSNILRLRWPFVAKVIAESLKESDINDEAISELLKQTELKFKNVFPEMEEDSLAGGLSNTIAGRICNYFDFHGGGYTIDGACSSSLLAVSKACDSIAQKDLLLALVGGVDLSLDPFELVGFSRAGALATESMLVYDKNSNGFWPGEGCGFVVLADYDYAVENKLNILGLIKGWGISSDGKGGLTRPNAERQYLAIKRSYEKAGYEINAVKYIEGHGTGTLIGDNAELNAFSKAINEFDNSSIYIGSVKANIGHTKAAAGLAGLIKSLLILKHKIIPPTTGCINPHALIGDSSKIKITNAPILVNNPDKFRIGISSMGFGGINTHVTIEEFDSIRKSRINEKEQKLVSSVQDTELFLFSAPNAQQLKKKLQFVSDRVREISYSELTDLSATLYAQLDYLDCRLAIETSDPDDLLEKLETAIQIIDQGAQYKFDTNKNIYYSTTKRTGKIGFLFPGQGTKALTAEGLLFRRYSFIKELSPLWPNSDFSMAQLANTDIAQPAIVATSIIAVKLLKQMGVLPDVVLGHSVGEISALYCSGSITELDAMSLVLQRGSIMHDSPSVKGSMVSISLASDDPVIIEIITNYDLSVACINSTNQVVLSGDKGAILKAIQYCKNIDVAYSSLHVENAFHSDLMKVIEPEINEMLDELTFSKPNIKMYSSITGRELTNEKQIKSNLCRQLSETVFFYDAFIEADKHVDIWVEAGAGNVLKNLAGELTETPVTSLDLVSNSMKGLFQVTALLFVSGSISKPDFLFSNRFYREFSFDKKNTFITNPCESFVSSEFEDVKYTSQITTKEQLSIVKAENLDNNSIQQMLLKEVSERLGLPASSINVKGRMLDDFHLNSLYVGHLISGIAVKYGLELTTTPTEYSNASLEEIGNMFEALNSNIAGNIKSNSKKKIQKLNIDGIGSWVYPFEIIKIAQPLTRRNKNFSPVNNENWIIIGSAKNESVLRDHLQLSRTGKSGILVLLFSKTEHEQLAILKHLVTAVLKNPEIRNIVLFQSQDIASGFLKSLYLEIKNLNVLVINIAEKQLSKVILKDEIQQFKGFTEVYYENETRFLPFISPVITSKNRTLAYCLNKNDVVVITGGAKGITFECARALSLKTGCKLILTGRTSANDDEVIRCLTVLKQQGIFAKYYSFDISDAEESAFHFTKIISECGIISAVIHGAGINNPQKISQTDEKHTIATIAPKLYGIRNIIANIDITKLKCCYSFGSIIAAAGMEGNADYALANEWLRNEVFKLKSLYPAVDFVNLEWSVWAGTGMGQSLGVLEALIERGIQPISLDDGISFFLNLFNTECSSTNLIVSGRFGKTDVLKFQPPACNTSLRFIEDIKLFYPKTELIADFALSDRYDLYLKDHIIEGQMVFPAVFGLEAMLQSVYFLNDGLPAAFSIEEIKFLQPIIIEPGNTKSVRVLAQRIGNNVFQVVLRYETDGFVKDYFKAIVDTNPVISSNEKTNIVLNQPLEFDINKELYGNVLFQNGVFRRIKNYHKLTPYSAIITTTDKKKAKYFSDFLPGFCVLSDAGMRDAAFHAIQACVPDFTLLPVRIGTCKIFNTSESTSYVISANEKFRNGDIFNYDISIFNEDLQLIEKWNDVEFKLLHTTKKYRMPTLLLKNVLERKLDEVNGIKGYCRIQFNKDSSDIIIKRADGRPLLLKNGVNYSNSNSSGIEVVVKSELSTACDVEVVELKTDSEWCKLLGDTKFNIAKIIKSETGESISEASTRVWGAIECLRKAGNSLFDSFAFSGIENGTIYFTSGDKTIVSFKCRVISNPSESIFSILTTK